MGFFFLRLPCARRADQISGLHSSLTWPRCYATCRRSIRSSPRAAGSTQDPFAPFPCILGRDLPTRLEA
jgi:hypothetical protein